MNHKKYLLFCMFLFCTIVLFHRQIPFLSVLNQNNISPTQVVIDVGHGGNDPGKVGINSAKEKDINLKIAQYLFRILTVSGYTVTMTRTQDVSLSLPGASNHKISDLNQRKEIMKQ